MGLNELPGCLRACVARLNSPGGTPSRSFWPTIASTAPVFGSMPTIASWAPSGISASRLARFAATCAWTSMVVMTFRPPEPNTTASPKRSVSQLRTAITTSRERSELTELCTSTSSPVRTAEITLPLPSYSTSQPRGSRG